jgi:O-antigen ligase
MYGIYAGILAIPLEALDLRFGANAGLTPAEGLLLFAGAVSAVRLLVSPARAPHPVHIWFAAFIGVASLGMFYADDTFIVARIVLFWGAFLAVSMLVASATEQELRRVLACIAITGGVVGLVALSTSSEQQLVAGGTIATNRAQASFAHPNVLAFALLLAIPPALALGLGARRLAPRLLYLALSVLAIAGLMLTLSRGGLVGGVISLLVLLAWPRFRAYAFVVLAVVLVFAAFNIESIQDSSELNVVGQRLGTLAANKGLSQNPRLEIWRRTPDLVIAQPLLGVGEGNFPRASPAYGIRDVGGLPYDHAHDLWLTVVAETGLIGLFVFGGFLLFAGRAAAQALRSTRETSLYPFALAIAAALIGLLVTSIGEYPPRTNVIMALILVEVGTLVGLSRVGGNDLGRREDLGGGHVL